MQGGKRKIATHATRRPIPSEAAVGWSVALSIAFMGTATAAMVWFAKGAFDALGSEEVVEVAVAARLLVAGVFFASVIFGGKGIKAAGGIRDVTGRVSQPMLSLTRKRFSCQGLLMIGAGVVGLAVELVIRWCVGWFQHSAAVALPYP